MAQCILGHADGVSEGILHAGQLVLAEVPQHGVDHGVQLPGEVVSRAEAAGAVHVVRIIGYLPLQRAAPDQRRAHDAELGCPGGVQVLKHPLIPRRRLLGK